MYGTKGSDQFGDPVSRQAKASVSPDASTQQTAEGRSSAATEYWQGVAPAGRTAKPAAASAAETTCVGGSAARVHRTDRSNLPSSPARGSKPVAAVSTEFGRLNANFRTASSDTADAIWSLPVG
jgi:hypothetical protein